MPAFVTERLPAASTTPVAITALVGGPPAGVCPPRCDPAGEMPTVVPTGNRSLRAMDTVGMTGSVREAPDGLRPIALRELRVRIEQHRAVHLQELPHLMHLKPAQPPREPL